ncbi:MAG: calcium/proton exchanger [Gemmatimonadota bacterium]
MDAHWTRHPHPTQVCMLFRWLLLAIPLSLTLEYVVHAPALVIFVGGIVAIFPLAEWIRRATEQMAEAFGSAIGGLLNVTFGNLAEMLLAIFVLLDGHPDVVKGQITGSILGNGLLGLGLAIVVGSWGRDKQVFNRASAGRLSSLLILAVIALLLPALFHLAERGSVSAAEAGIRDERLSLGVSVVLIVVYIANLIYSLVTHRDVFRASRHEEDEPETRGEVDVPPQGSATGATNADAGVEARWPVRRSLAVLVGATAFVAWEAELIAGSLTEAASSMGVSTFFLGIIVLAVIGNAAEYVSAVYFARQNRMSLVMGITVGSSIQVALFVAPLLVLISYALGRPMDLVFTSPLELIAIASVAFSVNAISQDGETTWFEGLLLLAVYALFVLAFLFVVP